ncbi:hypothetical protein [Pedobacter sp. SYSU D00535]|uniref:hypothetical protein n=1 Tax=Pedobacter sp. SYSU D00535 TaxID=2810308 RepID=UPI001A95701F|nr:hypothetical protein [Pedobacter sp. SYSU D00535]
MGAGFEEDKIGLVKSFNNASCLAHAAVPILEATLVFSSNIDPEGRTSLRAGKSSDSSRPCAMAKGIGWFAEGGE